MKNIQIQEINNKYKVKLHYGDKDLENTFDDADSLLSFIGKFLKEDNYTVIDIVEVKKIIKKLINLLSKYLTKTELNTLKIKIKKYIKGVIE